MNKQERVKEYIRKIAESNGLTYDEAKELKLVNIVLEYIESDTETNIDND